jgi:hypothetical protein
LAFSSRWFVSPKGLCIAVDAFDPSSFVGDFAIGLHVNNVGIKKTLIIVLLNANMFISSSYEALACSVKFLIILLLYILK